jgi:hypothetical protein
MPTVDRLRQLVAEVKRQIPEEPLSDRLESWVRVLGIDLVRFFRLLGVPDSQARQATLAALPQVIDSHEDRAEWVDELLSQLLASCDYDLEVLRTAMHPPAGPASEEQRPDAGFRLPYTPSPRVRRGLLLNQVVAGGPDASRALLAYLSEESNGDGRRARRKG